MRSAMERCCCSTGVLGMRGSAELRGCPGSAGAMVAAAWEAVEETFNRRAVTAARSTGVIL